MKILIEGHSYPKARIEEICGNFEKSEGDIIKVSKVGYFFNRNLENGVGDCVLCLPKVIKDEGKETYLGGLEAEQLIDAFSADTLDDTPREFIRNFSLWAYRTISTYARLNPKSSIATKADSSALSDSSEANWGTLMDIILAIIEFYNRNRDYFMYVIKNLHSGYNRINWRKTISKKTPFLQNGSPVYMEVINRKKQINFDEELMVIFYSILHYISNNLGIGVNVECNYNLITGPQFETYMDGYGERRLRAIKYKYFSDKDLQLWKLCFAFFQKTSRIKSADDNTDYLLIGSFNTVFEAMIDAIIGDPELSDIKALDDGKIIDHIFSHNSPIDGKKIYYIGDSKYYAIGAEIGDTSIYKQFTYAKNIIQYHFNGKLAETGYRDSDTEGYNFIPNFFISAMIPDSYTYESKEIKPHKDKDGKEDSIHRISHFENRLFDRDTLWLTHYDINLLYVMMLYARDDSSEQGRFKEEFKAKVYEAFCALLDQKYIFYVVTPDLEDRNAFIKEHFKVLNGKIYFIQDEGLVLALEKGCECKGIEIDESNLRIDGKHVATVKSYILLV